MLSFSGVSKTRTPGSGSLLNIFFFFFLFAFIFFLFFKSQIPISRNLHQQCIVTTLSDIKKMKFGGAHLLGTSPQTNRVTFQSRQSNVEAAQIYFLAQR